jgi:Ca2+-transporting ATPase
MIGAVSLATFFWADGREGAYWQTMVFTTLVVAQLAQALAVRSEQDSLLAIGIFSNPFLLVAIVLTLIAQLAVTYLPAMNEIFQTAPLTLSDLLVCLGLGAAVLPAVELGKWLSRPGRR